MAGLKPASPMSSSRQPVLAQRVDRPDWSSQAQLFGVGLEVFRRQQGDVLTVAAVDPGSSAQRAGITPGNRVTFLDDLDTSLMTLDQAKGMMMGAPRTTVKVEVSTAPLPPGTRSLTLVRGQGQELEPPPKHDFHRQKRPVPHDSLADMLSRSAAPADAPDAAETRHSGVFSPPPSSGMEASTRRGYEERVQLLTAQLQSVQRDYSEQMGGLAAQLQAATRENALLRERQDQLATAKRLDAQERDELNVARELLRDISAHHERTQPQSTVDYSAMVQDLKATIAQQQKATGELKEYIRSLEAQNTLLIATEKEYKQGQGTLQQLQGENARLKEELDNAKRDLEAARNRKPMQENPDRPMPSAGVSGAGVSGAGLVSSTQLADQEREMESLRALLVQANEAMQNMEDEKKRVESEFERSRFHEQVAEDRQALLQERDRQLMEAHKREDDLQMKLRELDRELKGVRDAALTEKGRQTDQNQLVESLQQQLEQMQLLALSQSREAEAAMIAMGDLKSIEMDQTSEILRLNALVADLEEHQKIQDQRVDASAQRWKIKRDQLVEDLDRAKQDVLQRDEVIDKHRLLIREYQSVLEVVKKAGGASKAFRKVAESTDQD